MFTPAPAPAPALARAARATVLFAALGAAALGSSPALAQTSMVRVDTTQGPIDVVLYDAETPKTVANFKSYVRSGAWVDSFVHRSVRNFVVQLGGYAWPTSGYAGHIATLPPVVNEFSAARSNLRGTVAMAKSAGNPDSATSEWFVNLADNSANLDNQNGGFTVFGRITAPGMAVVDKIAALGTVDAGGAFTNLPVVALNSASVQRENVVLVTRVSELPPLTEQSDSDRIFNYLEAAYPQYLQPTRGQGSTGLGYIFRYYSGTDAYIGTKDDKVWYLVPSLSPDVNLLGDMSFWLDTARRAGY